MWKSTRTLFTAFWIYLICHVFFLINIEYPRGLNFDEFHYVPPAKQILEHKPVQNLEHPPLGKVLLAIGIDLCGDEPLGWRVMSTLFGALTCVGMYVVALILFRNQSAALWTTGITFVNQLLYVQSRIGMLDTFMFGFLIWAMAAYLATWLPLNQRWNTGILLSLCGIFLGLTTACKWFGIVAWVAILGLTLAVILDSRLGIHLLAAAPSRKGKQVANDPMGIEFNSRNLVLDASPGILVLSLVILPILTYFASYTPYLYIEDGLTRSPWDWLSLQKEMYDLQLRVVDSHPYVSQWTGWAFLKRPIWYAFEKEPGDPNWVRGVILLGNPILMWLGLFALVPCLVDGLKNKVNEALVVIYFYCAFFLCWSVIPRKISFYYYYYPSGMILSFAFGYTFFLWRGAGSNFFHKMRWYFFILCACMFAYFFPVLSGQKILASSYPKWTWFKSWI